MGCKPCAEQRAAVMAAARAGNVREAGNLMAQGAKMMAQQAVDKIKPAVKPAETATAAATLNATNATPTRSRDSTQLHVENAKE